MFDADTVRAWIEDDPDATTAEELRTLLAAATSGDQVAADDLTERFSGTLTFGTAGLRGHLGAGPMRMNRAVVIRAAAGLCAVLRERVGQGFTVVVGRDARYGSKDFALDTCAVVEAAGGHALLLPDALPTPVSAFALRHLNADAAVMVTASHNPKEDNGYKVYLGGRVVTDWGQGSQIVPPFDSLIFQAIQAVESVASVPRAHSGWEILGQDLVQAYQAQVASLVDAPAAPLKIVATAMHGVGGNTMSEVLQRAGFTDIHVVAEQQDPDPDFPTVAFPNPEEKGALDLSMALARQVGADIIIANDPDADRCSAAVPDPSSPTGWRQLTGDQVGALLGVRAARLHQGQGCGTGAQATGAVLANSVVSSRLLGHIAHKYHVGYTRTLTGFKWISRVPGLVFGYEEALGYCVDPAHVRDKDGISACLELVELASQQKATGGTLQDILDELAVEFGLFATAPLTIRVEDLSLIQQGMAHLRAGGPSTLAGSPVVEVVDLTEGFQELPPTDGMWYRTEDDTRVVARPSGTEPKLKCYLEVVIPVDNGDVAAAQRVANTKLDAVTADFRAALGI